MKTVQDWLPPGYDCGSCGAPSCEQFTALIRAGKKDLTDCPYYTNIKRVNEEIPINPCELTTYSGTDIHGDAYDFILHPLPGEPSAQKIILPFRPDQVDRMDIRAKDIVTGRPMGAGCPVQHVLSVIHADPVTGLLTCHVVSPWVARDNPDMVKDVKAYHMIGFEGIAEPRRATPECGKRQRFLPGFCMMHLNHTGVVNMVLKKSYGIHVRIEDIIIW